MTTVYVPRLIESAEQAETLPVGTLAREGANVIIKSFDGRWWWAGLDGVVQPQAEAAVGWTALVPIEAEEEWTATGEDHGDPWIAHIGHDGIDGTREEAEAYTRRFGGFIAHRALTPWESV